MEETKSCPYCGEQILSVAVKCKHCGSDLSQLAAAVTQVKAQDNYGHYGFVLLAIPVVATLLIWFWIGSMALIQSPGEMLGMLTGVTIIATAVIVAIEAKKLGMVRDSKAGIFTPLQWFFALVMLWAIAYPEYFFKRKKFGLPNQGILAIVVVIVFVASLVIMHTAISDQQEKFQKGMQGLQDSVKQLGQSGETIESGEKIELGRSSKSAIVKVEYVKKNGVVEIGQQESAVAFSVNSSVGDNVCNLGDDNEPLMATMIDANRAIWTANDSSDKCTVILNFTNDHLNLTTKDCDGFCGVQAVGSMDGMYSLNKEKN